MTYSKRAREEAILICSIAAAVPHETKKHRSDLVLYSAIATAIPIDGLDRRGHNVYAMPSVRLAIAAWGHCTKSAIWTQISDAEAVSLLQEGWSP